MKQKAAAARMNVLWYPFSGNRVSHPRQLARNCISARRKSESEEDFMRRTWLATAALALAAALLVAGCSGQPLSEREKGTGIGALLGAGTGAIIGAAVGHPGAGAAIGGALGAGGGYVVGNELQNQQVQTQQTQSQLEQQQQEIENQRQQIEQMRQQGETE
jgi:hypothetical protein